MLFILFIGLDKTFQSFSYCQALASELQSNCEPRSIIKLSTLESLDKKSPNYKLAKLRKT